MVRTLRVQQIRTEAGVTLLPATSKALVQLGDRYVSRDACDLVPGDRVRFRKDHISRSIDEIDVVLSGASQRYVTSREQIMERNSLGLWIPKLRTLLLGGMNSQYGIVAPALAGRKIFLEHDDFSPHEYRFMADSVSSRIGAYAITNGLRAVCWDTTANWVMGRVIAPEQKRFFNALSAFNPAFSAIAQDFAANGPWAQAYGTYVTIRKVCMSYVAAQYNPPNVGPQQGAQQRPGASLAPELAAIVSTFAGDASSQYIDVEVLSNEELRQRKDVFRRRQKFEPYLFKGIVTVGSGGQGGMQFDSLDKYDGKQIFGTEKPLDNPEQAVEHAKLFALEHGFTLSELKKRLEGKPVDEASMKEFTETFLLKHGVGSVQQIRDTLLEGTGLRFEDLGPEGQLRVAEEVEVLCRTLRDSMTGQQQRIGRFIESIENLDKK